MCSSDLVIVLLLLTPPLIALSHIAPLLALAVVPVAVGPSSGN